MKLLKTLNSTLKSKVNSSEKNISDTTTLIHINQYHTGKIGDVDKNNRCKWFSDCNCFEYKN